MKCIHYFLKKLHTSLAFNGFYIISKRACFSEVYLRSNFVNFSNYIFYKIEYNLFHKINIYYLG